MKPLILILAGVVSLSPSALNAAEDKIYEGTWNTTNRKLDGAMTCVVSDLGKEKWQGRFSGVWQGVAFDYTVPFSGPPSDLRGTAQIDGADYVWKAQMKEGSAATLQGTFGGSRYEGYFDLKAKAKKDAK